MALFGSFLFGVTVGVCVWGGVGQTPLAGFQKTNHEAVRPILFMGTAGGVSLGVVNDSALFLTEGSDGPSSVYGPTFWIYLGDPCKKGGWSQGCQLNRTTCFWVDSFKVVMRPQHKA